MHESSRISQVNYFIKKQDALCYKIQAQFNNGIADCYYAGKSQALWIEYKQIKFPKRDTTIIVPKLSALQLNFLATHQRFNLSAWVVVFSDKGHFILKNHEHWVTGIPAAEARSLLHKTYKDIANEILQATN